MALDTRSLPAPIAVPASQDFDGNDGPWSSFALQIGTPPQNVKLLISTAGSQTWTVVPEGCTSIDPSGCVSSRGGQFDAARSTTWTRSNATSNGSLPLGLEANLGYFGSGEYGYDTVSLGWQASGDPSLSQQVVAGITTKEFNLGMFGLDPRPTNFNGSDHPVQGYLGTLWQKSLIPSLSWSYTAGNQYRLQHELGSLTLGGFDASRFIPNNVTFPFGPIDARPLTIWIVGVQMTSNNNTAVFLDRSESIAAFIDSTIPDLHLPVELCTQFERSFGITWNDTAQAYLVNDKLHSDLKAQNATVTFSFGTVSSTTSVDIALPYAAFDLQLAYPLATSGGSTRYFPLKRADNETQYTLGRTFLQEAYVTADYERRHFSVSQCNWDGMDRQSIIAIASPSTTSLPPSQADHDSPDAKRASPAKIAGITVGSVAGLILLTLLVFLLKRKRSKPLPTTKSRTPTELDAWNHAIPELNDRGHQRHFLDGREHFGSELDGSVKYELRGHDDLYRELSGGTLVSELPAKSRLAELTWHTI